jgi:hypothetical protein
LSVGVLPADGFVPLPLPPPLAMANAMPTTAPIAITAAPITVNSLRCLARRAS